MKLDRIDREILKCLQQDGRLTNIELAKKVGLSASPCLRRVKALEEQGVVYGYRALVEPKALGFQLMALIHISMDQHTQERFENFEKTVQHIPQVMECLLITGQQADYQLKVIVADMDAFQDLLLNQITRIRGVTGVHTSFVLRRVIDRTSVPLDLQGDD